MSETAAPQQTEPAGRSAGPGIGTGLACLYFLARYHKVPLNEGRWKDEAAHAGEELPLPHLMRLSQEAGFKVKALRIGLSKLRRLPLPAMITDREGGYGVLAKLTEEEALLFDPVTGRPKPLPIKEFTEQWGGTIILFTPRQGRGAADSPFGFRWFLPLLWKFRQSVAEVLAASLILQLFGIALPLIIQVVIDKVLVHNGLTTLHVLMTGLVVMACFEWLLGMARTYVYHHTTGRLDVILGTKLVRHLLRLPLVYFESRRVGDTMARVREMDQIRQFLTGSPLTALLDAAFIFLYVAVMLFYSPVLTCIVLGAVLMLALLSWGVTPVLRRRLEERYARSAESQAFMVESVSGMQTLKSFALESRMHAKWEELLAGQIRAGFRTSMWAGTAGTTGQWIQRLSTLGVLWYGAWLVLHGGLSVGGLIAFQMLSSRVSEPVLRLVQLWREVQQASLSIEKLKDVFETKPEPGSEPGKTRLPAVQGHIRFEGVRFRYRPGGAEVLQGISFQVKPGSVIGVVGRSGSGKSTLSKLIQRLYVPEAGRILIDGMDIGQADPVWLRRQIGVVLQESVLFSGSVRENIAIHSPGASMEAIVQAARMAGAHEFITDLPEGYDTAVGERGASLSGGQRQRIAIARALLLNPPILIFDEATSALDYESERIILQNLGQICRGRTVFIIAHRLSAMARAHAVMVLDKGRLVESGTHQELLEKGGLYAHLLRQQER
ncbi:peptidase domain-containing ABC transporter [Paenibacillus sp. S-38]|uniref:peptidase domain-containing ABC transporter n=1 Tax=Paenibacillus sp. S-38 TaxID=3416710 RepID=UPI003CF77726